jgi:hypothetical protein
MGSPRDDVVFRLWQCDKENHGWREGPPLTVPCQSFDLLAGPSPSRQNQLRTKKEYSFAPLAARSSIRTLAGLKRLTSQWIGRRCVFWAPKSACRTIWR